MNRLFAGLVCRKSNSHDALRHPVRVEPDPPISRELRLEGRVPPRPIVRATSSCELLLLEQAMLFGAGVL